MKKYTQKQWLSFELISKPTRTTGMIRKNEENELLEWKHGGKRVEAKVVGHVRVLKEDEE